VGIVDHQTIDEINILQVRCRARLPVLWPRRVSCSVSIHQLRHYRLRPQATMLAMRTAVEDLPSAFVPDLALIDGNRCPQDLRCASEALVKGDARCYSIAAASIVAKVTRDRLMTELHAAHPQYGFDRHMGYPTREHVAALHKYGPTDRHRRSFNPLRTWIAEGRVAGETAPPSALDPAPKKPGRPRKLKVATVAAAAELGADAPSCSLSHSSSSSESELGGSRLATEKGTTGAKAAAAPPDANVIATKRSAREGTRKRGAVEAAAGDGGGEAVARRTRSSTAASTTGGGE
jgi:ribonuclease HII